MNQRRKYQSLGVQILGASFGILLLLILQLLPSNMVPGKLAIFLLSPPLVIADLAGSTNLTSSVLCFLYFGVLGWFFTYVILFKKSRIMLIVILLFLFMLHLFAANRFDLFAHLIR